MLGIFPSITDEAAAGIGAMWGTDPVHPSEDAYKVIADALLDDIINPESRYTNMPKGDQEPNRKKPKIDLAATRQDWVSGCSATLPRRDTVSGGGGAGLPQEAPLAGAALTGLLSAEAVVEAAERASMTSEPSTGEATAGVPEGATSNLSYTV
jgi:hypothetical protein